MYQGRTVRLIPCMTLLGGIACYVLAVALLLLALGCFRPASRRDDARPFQVDEAAVREMVARQCQTQREREAA